MRDGHCAFTFGTGHLLRSSLRDVRVRDDVQGNLRLCGTQPQFHQGSWITLDHDLGSFFRLTSVYDTIPSPTLSLPKWVGSVVGLIPLAGYGKVSQEPV